MSNFTLKNIFSFVNIQGKKKSKFSTKEMKFEIL